MDIVYVYKQWWGNWQELRYSLRSLVNIPHDKVYIIGDKPDGVRWVIHIPVSDEWEKFENVIHKFKVIVGNENISDDFILMHDDFYIMEPMDIIPYYVRSSLKQHKEDIYNKFWENTYFTSINNVYKLFPEWDSFDVHCPIILNKDKFKHILDLYWNTIWSKRSIYCNYYHIEWVPYWNANDCKVLFSDRQYNKWNWFLSSDDSTIRNMWFIRYMNNTFPNKCKYEI